MVWRFLKKLKIELPYDPVISLLGIYPKEMKSLFQRHMCLGDRAGVPGEVAGAGWW